MDNTKIKMVGQIVDEALESIKEEVVNAYRSAIRINKNIDTGAFVESFIVMIIIHLQNSFIDPKSNPEEVARGVKSLMKYVSRRVNEIWKESIKSKKKSVYN